MKIHFSCYSDGEMLWIFLGLRSNIVLKRWASMFVDETEAKELFLLEKKIIKNFEAWHTSCHGRWTINKDSGNHKG